MDQPRYTVANGRFEPAATDRVQDTAGLNIDEIIDLTSPAVMRSPERRQHLLLTLR